MPPQQSKSKAPTWATKSLHNCIKDEPTDADREFVLWYVSAVHGALLSDCSLIRSLYYKYVLCLVI